MRKKFSENEIERYIRSEDIDDVEALESNPYFMSEVIKRTKDYNLYAVYCSDKMKLDPIIMKTMLEVFGNDYLEKDSTNFYRGLNILSRKSNSIDNFYSNNDSIHTQFLELVILLFKIDHCESDIANYHFEKELAFYTDEFGVINTDCNGLFKILCNKYRSDIVQEYYAVKFTEKIVDDVFYDDVDALSYRGIENIIHKKIEDKELLDSEMVVCSIISHIAEVDSSLADYLGEHKYLLEEYGKYSRSYYDHWDSYEKDKTFYLVDSFVSAVEDYIIDHQIDANSEDVVKAIGRRFGIENIFDDYYERLERECSRVDYFNDCLDEELDEEKRRKIVLETYREFGASKRADIMINSNVYRPLISLAKRTFVPEEQDSKVFTLALPISDNKVTNS